MIKLWETGKTPLYDAGLDKFEPYMTPYLVDGAKSAVIVLPGGGYTHRAPHEGEPYARWLNTLGISAFVLEYRIAPYRYPCPLLDAQRAVKIVRHNYPFDADKIGICGSSAGGHLAALTATATPEETSAYQIGDEIDKESAKVGFAILCYPVITSGTHAHKGSFRTLTGGSEDAALYEMLSIENRVTAKTCPMFVWHTANDGSVPVQNPLILASSLDKCGVPFELHIFHDGKHGLGLAQETAGVSAWPALCAAWLKNMGF